MSITDDQTEQTIPPLSVARELLIQTDSLCYEEVGARCWTDDLPTRGEFKNKRPGIVIIDNGGQNNRNSNEVDIEGVMRLRIWSGDTKVSSLWRVWHLVRKQLLRSSLKELSNDKENWSARWMWGRDPEPAQVLRSHPETGWPEINALVEYRIHSIEGA